MTHDETAEVFGMESVHILLGINGQRDGEFIDLFWQRLLHKNAVDGRVKVQGGDCVEQMLFWRVGRHCNY